MRVFFRLVDDHIEELEGTDGKNDRSWSGRGRVEGDGGMVDRYARRVRSPMDVENEIKILYLPLSRKPVSKRPVNTSQSVRFGVSMKYQPPKKTQIGDYLFTLSGLIKTALSSLSPAPLRPRYFRSSKNDVGEGAGFYEGLCYSDGCPPPFSRGTHPLHARPDQIQPWIDSSARATAAKGAPRQSRLMHGLSTCGIKPPYARAFNRKGASQLSAESSVPRPRVAPWQTAAAATPRRSKEPISHGEIKRQVGATEASSLVHQILVQAFLVAGAHHVDVVVVSHPD